MLKRFKRTVGTTSKSYQGLAWVCKAFGWTLLVFGKVYLYCYPLNSDYVFAFLFWRQCSLVQYNPVHMPAAYQPFEHCWFNLKRFEMAIYTRLSVMVRREERQHTVSKLSTEAQNSTTQGSYIALSVRLSIKQPKLLSKKMSAFLKRWSCQSSADGKDALKSWKCCNKNKIRRRLWQKILDYTEPYYFACHQIAPAITVELISRLQRNHLF